MAFDLRVQSTDAKTGELKDVKENHYVLHISEGGKRFERPIGSGHFFDEAGKLVQSPKVEAKAK